MKKAAVQTVRRPPAVYGSEYSMKIDRLIGILAVLQRQGQATMPELAEKFEVSRRTIARDIDALCRAGFPVVTRQGEGGGVELIEGHSINEAILTREELSAVLTGLTSLQSVSAAPEGNYLPVKLGGQKSCMEIDLASFYKEDLADKIRRLREAIEARRRVRFVYYSQRGEEERDIEPVSIIYKWSDWYVFGYCARRQDFRLFKLRRLWQLDTDGERFEPRSVPEEKKRLGSHMTDDYMIEAIYEPSVKYRLVEEYGPDSYQETEDGRLYTQWGFSTPERAEEWLLSFGDQVKVIGPDEMVRRMKEKTVQMAEMYK